MFENGDNLNSYIYTIHITYKVTYGNFSQGTLSFEAMAFCG